MNAKRWGSMFRAIGAAAMVCALAAPPSTAAFADVQLRPGLPTPTPDSPIGQRSLAAAAPLLDRLKTAVDADAANALVAQIWDAWTESGDPGIDDKMSQALALMQVQRYDEAVAVLDGVVASAPNFAEGWNRRATVLYLMQDLDRSEADIEKTLTLEPRHFGALSGLALIATVKDNKALALNAWRRVLEINPQNAGAREKVEQLTKELSGSPT